MNKNLKEFFKELALFLSTHISPVSNDLDHDDKLLKSAYQQLAELGGLHLLIPSALGGLGGGREDWIEYNVQMAKYSGALLFLQAQHQYAIAQLRKFLPHARVQETLQYLVESNHGIGVSLSVNKQWLEILPTGAGFRLSGQLKWVTGLNYFPEILLSFHMNDLAHYTLLPFQTLSQYDGSLTVSCKHETVVFSSTNTVSIELQNWFVAENEIIAVQPFSPRKPMEHPAVYNFAGVTKALLEIATQGKHGGHPHVEKNYRSLFKEWQDYYACILQGESCPLELRTMGLKLAERCAIFARMICGSEGLLASHPLTRISREIWQYTIVGSTQDQLESYLNIEKTEA